MKHNILYVSHNENDKKMQISHIYNITQNFYFRFTNFPFYRIIHHNCSAFSHIRCSNSRKQQEANAMRRKKHSHIDSTLAANLCHFDRVCKSFSDIIFVCSSSDIFPRSSNSSKIDSAFPEIKCTPCQGQIKKKGFSFSNQ